MELTSLIKYVEPSKRKREKECVRIFSLRSSINESLKEKNRIVGPLTYIVMWYAPIMM